MPRPRISTNLAISADGKITSPAGMPSAWTSQEDHQRLLELRKSADALLVGRGTLEADRMKMTVPGAARQPLRCIVSRSGGLDPAHPVFHTEGGEIHLLVTGETPEIPGELLAKLTIHRGSVADFLERLGSDHGVRHLHCEGGGQLVRELAQLDLIDDFHLTLASHTVFGGRRTRTATGVPGDFLPRSAAFDITRFEPRPASGECFVDYRRALGGQ